MSTNAQIIGDAMELLGILTEGAVPSAEQADHGLRRLNQMMATWDTDGIVLGYFQQSDATASCPIPDWAEKGVMGYLALDIAPHYGRTVSPEALKVSLDGYELILRRLISQGMDGADLSHLGSGNARYNILTDSF